MKNKIKQEVEKNFGETYNFKSLRRLKVGYVCVYESACVCACVCVCVDLKCSLCVCIHNIIVLEVWKILSIHIKFYFIFMKNEIEKEKAKKRVIDLGNIEKGYGHFFPFPLTTEVKFV